MNRDLHTQEPPATSEAFIDPKEAKLHPARPDKTVVVGSDVLYALPKGSKNPGELRPAKVVRVWSQTCVNLMVFTDGSNDGLSDCYRVTSALYGEGYDTWQWPLDTAPTER
jgi:hypothetical protein